MVLAEPARASRGSIGPSTLIWTVTRVCSDSNDSLPSASSAASATTGAPEAEPAGVIPGAGALAAAPGCGSAAAMARSGAFGIRGTGGRLAAGTVANVAVGCSSFGAAWIKTTWLNPAHVTAPIVVANT